MKKMLSEKASAGSSDQQQLQPKARWGLVSTARVNRHIIAATQNSTVGSVVAVASRTSETAEKYAGTQNISKFFSSYNAMLKSDDVDCVYVSLPNNSHTDIVIKAAENKKHILCEKPMAPTAAEVSKMFDAAEKYNVMLMEGFMNLHSAVVHKARQLLEDGAIGEVIAMNATFTYTETRGGFRRTASIAEGGGVLYDVGSYCVALARFLVGREPATVHCVQEKVPVPAESDVSVSPPASPNAESSSDSTTTGRLNPAATADIATQVDETSAGTLMFPKRKGLEIRPSPLNGAITFQFLASFSSPLNMGFTILGTKGQMKIRNPFKPDPQREEEIWLQHDIDEPPIIYKVKGVGLQEDATGHLYQGEVDAISKFALAARAATPTGDNAENSLSSNTTNNNNNTSGMFHASSASMLIPGTSLLSRAFSVGNATVLEALHRSASTGVVQNVVVQP